MESLDEKTKKIFIWTILSKKFFTYSKKLKFA